jgi:uncharacterized repeat protein (TIGR03843 family)
VPEDERERPADHVSTDVSPSGEEPTPETGAAGAEEDVELDETELPADRSEWLEVLAKGDVEVEGRLPWSSNYSFLVTLTYKAFRVRAVYKPGRGERHLWDFGVDLFRREVAAYEVSAAVGLDLVPETVFRVEAPLGEGSVQRFVDADFEQHYFSLISEPAHDARLRELAGLDLLLNNADRKGGHVLVDFDGAIWGIDNGLCFHCEPKLRTVMWDFAGEPVPDGVIEAAAVIADGVPEPVCALISEDEVEALTRRARALVRRPKFPAPGADHRSYPWPLV